ncbi:MAG: alpha/beta hydrolase [Oscillospiraceae bacterium]|nr:alpha/beta hydrolase [Oscillospiraceae bacterium]
MIFNAKNGTINIDGVKMEYVRFGNGSKTLIMLPGLGDSLRSLKGMALPLALTYWKLSKDYTVYVFGRRGNMPCGFNTNNMADDLKYAMDRLNISKASVIGVSMGGMIAQHLAADYPKSIDKLVLVVTAAKNNPTLTESIDEWISLAERGDHHALMDSNLRRIYSHEYYRRNKWAIPIVGALTKPKSYDNFIIQANACKGHDAFNKLINIQAPTLVIGGKQDNTLSGESSEELAEQIPNSQLIMYNQYGHGLYDEADDFQHKIARFLNYF